MADVVIGFWGTEKPKAIEISSDDRRHHAYIVGQTGTGKSTLIKNMAIQDIRKGAGVGVIDPHGDLVEDILNFIPKKRTNDVVYLNPADIEHPAGLNILEARGEAEKQLAASALVSVFRHLWINSWGPRTEYLLYNAVLALMDTPGQTLLGVYRILIDAEFRRWIAARAKDPIVRTFWQSDFEGYGIRFVKEVIAPLQNKVGQLLTSAYLRNMIGQPKSTVDLRGVMNRRKILLVNLSKGRIGEDRANLLGSIVITKLYLAARERQQQPEARRRDFYLYVDEFQNFSTDVFPSILSESRKYRLNLILAHQYLKQVPEDIRSGVFGNVGSWIAFRVGSEDALTLEREFMPYFDAEDMRRQQNFSIIYKILRGGVAADPSSGRTNPPLWKGGDETTREAVIKASRGRYARERAFVEEKIKRWFAS